MANSLPGSPIVGYYNEEKGDFEEHNRIIDISNGKFQIKDTTRPYGFVDLNAKCWFQKFEDDGVEHEYLMTEGWLWTGQYPEAKRIIEHGNNQSMELDEKLIDAHWTKDDNGRPQFFIINEAIISKLCILGENCEPCFEGAQITKVQFSFEDSFEQKLFSMMKEVKEILNEGGASVFTRYAVEIGDSLWSALYSHVQNSYPDAEDCYCSVYRIEGIYEEESQKFAILQNRKDMKYYRLNFSLTENGFAAEAELVEVTKDFVPAAEPQFALEDYENYETEYAAKKKAEEEEESKDDESDDEEKCPECGKPISECECDHEDDEEDEEKKGKKAKYVLEEIPEYMELSQTYSALKADYDALVAEKTTWESDKANLETTVGELTNFKKGIERKEKENMINNDFCMVPVEMKQEIIDNIDTYSLDDIEAKLSIICVRNKVSFNLDEEDDKSKGVTTFNLTDSEDDDDSQAGNGVVTYNLGSSEAEDESIPAWVKAALATQKTL